MTKRLGVRILICLASLALGLNAEIMRNGMLQQLNGFHIGNSTGAELGNMFSNILADPENGLIKRAEQALGQRLTEAVENFNVSDTCLNHTEMFLQGLVARQSWAFRMVDSMGKPPPGLMNGNLNWLGSYDECLAIDVHGNVPSFTGRYCTATAVIPQMSAIIGSPAVLRIGLCVPNSCDSNDTTGLLNTLLSLIPMNSSALPHPQVKCQKESIELDTKAKIVIGVMSLFGLIMVIATAYDVIVIQWWSTKSEALPDYKVMKNDCVAVKVTKLSGEQYGTSESLKSTEVNYGAMSNGVSQYDLSKSDSSLVKKEEKYVPGKFGQALLSFSVYTNASKILNTNQPKGTLSAINGIRFVSMTWVIMGHSFGGSLQFAVVAVIVFLAPVNCFCFGLELRGVEAERGLLNLFSILFNTFAGLAMPVIFSACLQSLPLSSNVVLVDPFKLVSDPHMLSLLDRLRNTVFLHVQVPAPDIDGPCIVGAVFAFFATFFHCLGISVLGLCLCGLLVSYLGLKELKKRGGASKFNWGMFYFHRFWRLTPPYMLFLMFYVCLEKYWSDGPLWPQQGTEINDCKDSWWRSLLYINNLIKPNEQCMGWGWYLANDMQFYIVSPLMLIPLYYSKVLGSISCAAFLLCSIISTWVITAANNFGPSILGADQAMMGEYYNKVYVKPWCRVGPYAVGFFTGYLLYKTDCKIKIPKIAVLIGWAFATAIALLVLYGLYDKEKLFPDLSTQVSAFYSATHRSAWGVAVCWVIFACATGHGGFVNTLLSWKALIPLSRLTYCAYLVHLVVMDVYQNSKRSLVYFTDLEEIYWFLAHLVMSYATAFVVSLTFEAPMMGLEKALLGRAKNS